MKRFVALGIFGVFLFFSLTIWAQVPQLLNYQGRLTDDRGIPIITTTTVRFSLYQGGDAATPGSGTLCYQEDASVTPDDNGVFSHLIGSGTVIYGALDATVFQTADPVYLEIAIDPAGANETLLPRKQIVTVGYSFKAELADDADTVDGQDASAFSPVVHNHDPDYVNEGQADSVTSAMIADGTIVDADISALANIAGSKIDTTGLDADLLDGKDSEDFVHTAGDDMTGTLYVDTSSTYALYGTTSDTMGTGVYGYAAAASGGTYGLYGLSVSSNGMGVYGQAPKYGVYGIAYGSSGSNFGVYGESQNLSGSGVYGRAPNSGVYGYATANSGNNNGVYGQSDSTSGRGVYGGASAPSGTTYGVFGLSNSPSGYGVYGRAPNYGVYGEATATTGLSHGLYGVSKSTSGRGVYGQAIQLGVYGFATGTSGRGVYGQAADIGVYGISTGPSGRGVFGTAATNGVYGQATATDGTTWGVYGLSNSPSGYGVYGYAAAASGSTVGVHGKNDSTNGQGVLGFASATSGESVGVYGVSYSPSGKGVYGQAPTYGLYGETIGSVVSYGVYGRTNSTGGRGVYGGASAPSGTTYGVYGLSNSPSGYGIYGTAPTNGLYGQATATDGTTYGVYGRSDSNGTGASGVYGAALGSGVNYGVYGTTASSSTYASGVYGLATATSGTTYGVYAGSASTSGYGVFASAPYAGVSGIASATSGTTYGVYGRSDSTSSGYGVYGTAPNYGVYGQAAAYGVYGLSSNGAGVYGEASATSGENWGVMGISNSDSGYGVFGYCLFGYAGYFMGNTHVTGNFTVAGSKTCVQPIENGKKVLLYAMESPEIWFEDFGTAQLVNGQAVVQLESVFTQAANTEIGYFVFPIPNGDCNGLYIARQDKDSFEVRELGGGTSSISFYYRIVAKRRGYEEVRFEEFTEPEQTPVEPNLPVEKK